MTHDMDWSNVEVDHIKPICLFDVTKDDELKEVLSWENTQPILKEVHQQKCTEIILLNYQPQFIEACQFLKLNEERPNQRFFIDEIYSKPPKITSNHTDEWGSIDLADMIENKISNNKGFGYIFVIFDNFSK